MRPRPIAYFMTCNLGYPPSTKYAQPQKYVTSYIILLVIATSSDIEANSGPRQPKFPCGTCGKAVTWKQKRIRCDNSECQKWYHTDCQNIRSTIYECMNSSNCVWECLQCAMPNVSTTLFELHSISSDNNFSKLSESCDSTDCSGCSSPGPPLASSSPTKSCDTLRQYVNRNLFDC